MQTFKSSTWLLFADNDYDARNDFTTELVRKHQAELKVAARVLIVSAAVAGICFTMIPMSGAVVLPGTLVVESNVKKIQHPTGGVVAEFRSATDACERRYSSCPARSDPSASLSAAHCRPARSTRVRMARLVGERVG